MDNALNTELLHFIDKSVSPFHAIDAIRQELVGYTALQEGQPWSLQPGGRYYVTRNGSAIIAFRIPEADWQGILMAVSHSDSPTFKLRENAMLDGPDGYARLNVERYGGTINSTWLDRPLGVAGRVMVRCEDRIESRLVDLGTVAMIPNVAIHMNRKMNEGYAYDLKTDLVPLWGLAGGPSVAALAARAAGAAEENVICHELALYTAQPGFQWGAQNEFISSPRLDDLQCAFATLKGFLSAKAARSLPLYCVMDNEEVGSGSKQGAAGTFLRDVLERICAATGRELTQEAAHSFLLSADNAHAVHPNHPEYADATHRPKMNGGIVVKYSAAQRYTTDAVSRAVFTEICRSADVPVQFFANRPDVPGGSTLGNIANSQISLNSVDIGLPQLAMHSACETAGALDTGYLVRAATAFYGTALVAEADGRLLLH